VSDARPSIPGGSSASWRWIVVAGVIIALFGAVPESAADGGDELSEFLCCGQTTGGTRIWGISFPKGWRVVRLPENPYEFYGALFIEPETGVVVAYVPAATTVPGAATDIGDVDGFLNGLVGERSQEFPGFREVHRQPLPGIANGRLWVGTWPGAKEQMWESLIAVVTPTNLERTVPGMPRGNLTMMGVRAPSSQWTRASQIYERMVASTKVKMMDGSLTPYDDGVGAPAVKSGMVRFCPYHCDWIWVDADRRGWACPRDGAATEPFEVSCVGREGPD